MKKVTAQSVDTYVRPDTSHISQLSQRQQQVSNAFQSLGVNMKQDLERDLYDTRQDAIKAKEEQEARDKLKFKEVAGKIELAQKYLAQVEYQNADPMSLGTHESVTAVRKALDTVEDGEHKAALTQELDMMLQRVDQGHALNRQKEADMTAYSSVIAASLLDKEYDASTVNGLINDHKGLLGYDAVAGMATVAIKAEELPMITALLGRDDLDVDTRATLESAKGQIEASLIRSNQKATAETYFDINRANDIQDRAEKYQALGEVFAKHEPRLSENQKGSILASMATLEEELKSEAIVTGGLTRFTTRELAENMPEGYRSLSQGEVRKIQNREWRKAMAEGRIEEAMLMMDDPNDIPSAAKEYFGKFLADLSRVEDVANVPDGLSKTYELTRQIDAQLGAGYMKSLMAEEPYAEFQIFRGIAEQNGIGNAIADLKAYKEARLNGNTLKPEGFATMRRDVLSSVADHIDSEDAAYLDTMLSPFFKVWGARGMSEEQMTEMATKIVEDSAWGSMANGVNVFKAFHKMRGDATTPKYKETEEELYNKAVSLFTEKFRERQPALAEELKVTVLPSNPDYVVFEDQHLAIPGGIVHVEKLVDIAKANTKSTLDKIIQELDNKAIREKWEKDNPDHDKHPIYGNADVGLGTWIKGLTDG